MKVSIIMPAYNEEKRIGRTLEEYISFFRKLKEEGITDFEIVAVLNACRDNTRGVVKNFSRKYREIRYLDFERGGKGFAITEGFRDALKRGSELIGFVDADMATPPGAFYDLIGNISGYNGVIANRWDKRSRIETKQPLLRRIMSRGYNFIVRSLFLLPHRDTQCGAKVFRRELIEKILPKLGSSEWGYDVDLLFYARKEGARIKSIPTIWNDQKGSKIDVKKTPLKMFLSAVRLRLLHSPFRFIVRVYRKLNISKKIYDSLK
ncbi:MAG: glycosyltransferase [Nanoarchaeota archaeon]